LAENIAESKPAEKSARRPVSLEKRARILPARLTFRPADHKMEFTGEAHEENDPWDGRWASDHYAVLAEIQIGRA